MNNIIIFTRVLEGHEVNKLTDRELTFYHFWLEGYKCAATDALAKRLKEGELTSAQRRGL